MRIKSILIILILIISVLIAGSVSAHEGEEEETEHEEQNQYNWVGHALLSVIALILSIIMIFTGGLITKRFKKPIMKNAFKTHKIVTRSFFVIILITFFYGLWLTSTHDTPLLNSAHGIIGLIIIIFTILALLLNPCFVNNKKVSKIHSYFGFVILLLVIIQIIFGIQNVI
jgi:cytochrome bd-type quinol oxidase subunit 2